MNCPKCGASRKVEIKNKITFDCGTVIPTECHGDVWQSQKCQLLTTLAERDRLRGLVAELLAACKAVKESNSYWWQEVGPEVCETLDTAIRHAEETIKNAKDT